MTKQEVRNSVKEAVSEFIKDFESGNHTSDESVIVTLFDDNEYQLTSTIKRFD